METDTPGGPMSHAPSTASSYGAESIDNETREDEAERERQIQQMIDEAEAKHQTGDYRDFPCKPFSQHQGDTLDVD